MHASRRGGPLAKQETKVLQVLEILKNINLYLKLLSQHEWFAVKLGWRIGIVCVSEVKPYFLVTCRISSVQSIQDLVLVLIHRSQYCFDGQP